MRHGHGYRKLGRQSAHRRALLRNMATSFFINDGKIKTTLHKAKELRPLVESIITSGKKGTLAARRQVASYLFKSEATKAVFDKFAAEYADRKGGYTRVLKIGPRKGDGAEMAHLELVGYTPKEKAPKKKPEESEAAAPPPGV